jgi:hypothetical protein
VAEEEPKKLKPHTIMITIKRGEESTRIQVVVNFHCLYMSSWMI